MQFEEMANDSQRQVWFKELDDAVEAVLKEPRAKETKVRERIFQRWRGRISERLGIGRGVEGHDPPKWLKIREDFEFVKDLLDELRRVASEGNAVSLYIVLYLMLLLILSRRRQ